MRIRSLAERLATTAHTIRFYERQGFTPVPERTENGYRDYSDADADRLQLLIGLRRLDLPLSQAAELARLCAEGRCDQMSQELRTAVAEKRRELAKRVAELQFLDQRLARLAGQLDDGGSPRTLISNGKEECDVSEAMS